MTSAILIAIIAVCLVGGAIKAGRDFDKQGRQDRTA